MQGTPKDPSAFPFIVVGNKLDLCGKGGGGMATGHGGHGGGGNTRKISEQKGKAWAKKNGDLAYFETSAKANMNVEETFTAIAKAAASHDDNEM